MPCPTRCRASAPYATHDDDTGRVPRATRRGYGHPLLLRGAARSDSCPRPGKPRDILDSRPRASPRATRDRGCPCLAKRLRVLGWPAVRRPPQALDTAASRSHPCAGARSPDRAGQPAIRRPPQAPATAASRSHPCAGAKSPDRAGRPAVRRPPQATGHHHQSTNLPTYRVNVLRPAYTAASPSSSSMRRS
ncbi:MAG: hypothetical protein FJ011_08945 [Chloroflexi bacterium]|nr:hypothetical protein [Chloroflexota bacterium]